MEYKPFYSLLRLAVYALAELKKEAEFSVLFNMDENVYRLVFSKVDDNIFDFLVFDHSVENPVLFGEGYEDSGTGHIQNEDFFMQDLLEIFYPQEDFSLN